MMRKFIAFTGVGLGMAILLSSGHAMAQVTFDGADAESTTETNIRGSADFGFNPSALLAAVNPDRGSNPSTCFTCKNPNAGGTTAGALTNSMFGALRPNTEADLGEKAFTPGPGRQGQNVPTARDCNTPGCNDSTGFTFSLPLPALNFLAAGTPVMGATIPPTDPAEPVGRAGVKMSGFQNAFTFNGDGTSSFSQNMEQVTFTEGLGGSELQFVNFSASSTANPANSAVDSGSGGTVNWAQSIEEGGFALDLSGSFTYMAGEALGAPSTIGLGSSTP